MPFNVTAIRVVQFTEVVAAEPIGTFPKLTEEQFKGKLTGAPRP